MAGESVMFRAWSQPKASLGLSTYVSLVWKGKPKKTCLSFVLCWFASDWEELFFFVLTERLKVLSACEKGGRWYLALSLLEAETWLPNHDPMGRTRSTS